MFYKVATNTGYVKKTKNTEHVNTKPLLPGKIKD